jgi:hypothetical protein
LDNRSSGRRSRHRGDDLRVVGFGVSLSSLDGAHDHAGGAAAAPECIFGEERILNGMRFAGREASMVRDRFAVRLETGV